MTINNIIKYAFKTFISILLFLGLFHITKKTLLSNFGKKSKAIIIGKNRHYKSGTNYHYMFELENTRIHSFNYETLKGLNSGDTISIYYFDNFKSINYPCYLCKFKMRNEYYIEFYKNDIDKLSYIEIWLSRISKIIIFFCLVWLLKQK